MEPTCLRYDVGDIVLAWLPGENSRQMWRGIVLGYRGQAEELILTWFPYFGEPVRGEIGHAIRVLPTAGTTINGCVFGLDGSEILELSSRVSLGSMPEASELDRVLYKASASVVRDATRHAAENKNRQRPDAA
jgi:hypothetical protein